MRAARWVLVVVLAACSGSSSSDGGFAGGSAAGGSATGGGGNATGGGVGGTGGGVSGSGGGVTGTGGGVTGTGGGVSGTGGGVSGTGGGDTGTGGGVSGTGGGVSGTGGGMVGTGGGTGGSGGGMPNTGPLTAAITTPAGPFYARAMVEVGVTITGAPDMVVLVIDGMPTVQVLPPYTGAMFDTTALAETSHTVLVRATNSTNTIDSAPLTVIVDRTAPTVVRRWPTGAGGWLGETFGVEFSEPIVPASVTAGALTAAFNQQPVTTSTPVLSQDGLTLRAKASQPPAGFPAAFGLTLGGGLTDKAGNAVAPDAWAAQIERWQVVSLNVQGSQQTIASDGLGTQWVVALENGTLVLHKLSLGKSELIALPLAGSSPDLAIDPSGRPVLAYIEGANVIVRRLEQNAWVTMGLALGAGTAPQVVVDSTGAPIVAFNDGAALQVSKWDGTQWVAGAAALPGVVTGFSLMLDSTEVPVLAYVVNGRLNVAQATGTTGWAPLGGVMNVNWTEEAKTPSLARSGATFYVAWEEHETVHASQWNGTAWSRMWRPLDIDNKSPAFGPQLGVGGNGALTVVWTEQGAYGKYFTQCARWLVNFSSQQLQWEPCGGEAAAYGDKLSAPALAMNGDIPVVALASNTTLMVSRWNGVGVGTRYGMNARPAPTACNLDQRYPSLSQTSCFDVTTNPPTPAGDLVPFDLNSPLWSDGALKRRWIRLPPGGTIGYQKNGPWTYPVGTIMAKEFSYNVDPADPTTRRPTETRFLVKKPDGTWEGFSYQWADDFSDATLMTNTAATVRKFWPYAGQTGTGPDAGYTQLYPGNTECFDCHRSANGFVLGMQGGQLNRNMDYGNGMVDNELRALQHLGFFGPDPLGAAARWVNVHDQTESLENRVRGYIAANCSHCHRPGGLRPTRDFRWETPFANTHICDASAPLGPEVIPGDATNSLMHIRISTRGPHGPPHGQMPPEATDVQDWAAVSVVEQWINNMTSCP